MIAAMAKPFKDAKRAAKRPAKRPVKSAADQLLFRSA
jgi:hypothetical protein